MAVFYLVTVVFIYIWNI